VLPHADEQAKVGLGADGTADLSLWISPKHWAGQDAAEELDDVPVYAHLKVLRRSLQACVY
jgi:hypothetical protein